MNGIDEFTPSIYPISKWRPSAYKRRVLVRAVLRIFRHWNLKPGDQLQLLGLSRYQRRRLHLLQFDAIEPLSSDAKLMMRRILRLYGWLLLTYPFNPEIQQTWFHSSHQSLHGKSPLQLISTYGVKGWLQIEQLLDG